MPDITPEEDRDYITLMACVNPQRAIVAIMHYRKDVDSYVPGRMSDALSLRAAHALAASWAAATHMEIR